MLCPMCMFGVKKDQSCPHGNCKHIRCQKCKEEQK